jgi:hypothetical protein
LKPHSHSIWFQQKNIYTILFYFGNKYITNPQLDLEDYEVRSARAPDFMATTNKSYFFHIMGEYIFNEKNCMQIHH